MFGSRGHQVDAGCEPDFFFVCVTMYIAMIALTVPSFALPDKMAQMLVERTLLRPSSNERKKRKLLVTLALALIIVVALASSPADAAVLFIKVFDGCTNSTDGIELDTLALFPEGCFQFYGSRAANGSCATGLSLYNNDSSCDAAPDLHIPFGECVNNTRVLCENIDEKEILVRTRGYGRKPIDGSPYYCNSTTTGTSFGRLNTCVNYKTAREPYPELCGS